MRNHQEDWNSFGTGEEFSSKHLHPDLAKEVATR